MRRPLIVLLVIAALAPTTALASEWYRCADGEARASCCCPPGERDVPVDGAPRLERAACCEVERAEAQSSDLRVAHPGSFAGLAPPEVPAIDLARPPARHVERVAAVTAAEPRGPPDLFLRNCAWLR